MCTLTCSVFSSTNECSTTQSNWILIGCPYLVITIEYPVEIVFFLINRNNPYQEMWPPINDPMQANVPWGEFFICCQTKWKKCYFNCIDLKHNFLLNPKWKWHLLKALTFKTRYNNQHAHPNVGYSCKTRENMPQYIHENLFLDVSNNKIN